MDKLEIATRLLAGYLSNSSATKAHEYKELAWRAKELTELLCSSYPITSNQLSVKDQSNTEINKK